MHETQEREKMSGKNERGLKIPLLDNIPLYHMLKLGDRYQHIWDN
jgi:hypothetical protein